MSYSDARTAPTRADKNLPSVSSNVLGPAGPNIVNELKKMYWDGVKSEIEQIILALQDWNRPEFEYSFVGGDCRSVQGLEPFLDQVNEATRTVAYDYRQTKKNKRTRQNYWSANLSSTFDQALQQRARALKANFKSQELRNDVEMHLQGNESLSKIERLARMLVQSVGWLDVDKLVEHRKPLSTAKFWKRPAPAQLELTGVDNCGSPIYKPLSCSTCTNTIRGTMFQCRSEGKVDHCLICQDCYDEGVGQDRTHLVKVLKYCVLDKTLSPTISRTMCKCLSVPRIDAQGSLRDLFPMPLSEQLKHRQLSSALSCSLLRLDRIVAEAKYSSILGKAEKRQTLAGKVHHAKKARKENQDLKKKKKKGVFRKIHFMRTATKTEKMVFLNKLTNDAHRVELREEDAARDVPWFVKPHLDKYAFGNVHMALRFGPLVFENGIPHTHRGAVITHRPSLSLRMEQSRTEVNASCLTVGRDRILRSQPWPQSFKRYKAIMKQVVGEPFSGTDTNKDTENEIIQLLVECSKLQLTGLDTSEAQSIIAECVNIIFTKVQTLLEFRADIFLRSVGARLASQDTVLEWDPKTNNCQMFCDSLIDTELFGPLVHQPDEDFKSHNIAPLYLLSFVCRPSAYKPTEVETKFDVPNGLIEEYLLSFRYGCHVDSDLVDSLSEYWHDWAALGGHLYPHQDLFPWDCTEAYCRSRNFCGDCSLFKHLWAFPFDSFSITEMHLTRSRDLYSGPLSGNDWASNRLRVLAARENLLLGARAIAQSRKFQQATRWLGKATKPQDERVKLGGIHRAQPYSHQYDHGIYHIYFTAAWVHLDHADRVKAYEACRQARVKLPDVQQPTSWSALDRFESDQFNDDSFLTGIYAGTLVAAVVADGSSDNADGLGSSMGNYCADGWDGPCGMYDEDEVVLEGAPGVEDGGDSGGGCGGDDGGCGGGCAGD